LSGPLVNVLNGKPSGKRPIWFMRQAGRYLPEYRALRAKAGSFLQLCYSPEMACEVTLQPLRRFDFDAAIIFADILVVPHAMGLALEFAEGEGPRLQTVSDEAGVKALRSGQGTDQYNNVCETAHLVRKRLEPERDVIGFCGAPWTVASYMIEGRSSTRTKATAIAAENPVWFGMLLDRLVAESIAYLSAQIVAGCDAVQVFDSWAGDLSGEVLQRCVIEPIAKIRAALLLSYPDIPVIVFARGVGDQHGMVAELTGASGIGIESGYDLSEVFAAVPAHVAIQGNLDPEVLLGPWQDCRDAVELILNQSVRGRHIFNLGHGILPPSDPGVVEKIIAVIREFDDRTGA
jgi:uroporphyrinogen decarboxylase